MTGERPVDVAALAAGITNRDRRALAQAITLVESTRADHRAAAELLLDALPAPAADVVRIGISGAPGVGKSTLIEALGQLVLARASGSRCWRSTRPAPARGVRSSATRRA